MTTAGSSGERRRTSSAKRCAQLLAGFVGTSLLTLGLWIGTPTSASAIAGASCSSLDASCLTQSVREEVDEITRATGAAANDLDDHVGGTVTGATDAVERVLGAAGSSGIPAPGGGAGGGDGAGGDNDGGGKPQTRGNDHVSGPRGRGRSDAVGDAPRAIALPNVRASATTSSSSEAQAEAPDRPMDAGSDGSVGVGGIAADIGRRLALPLAFMLMLVLAFVAMQGRLDRGDPKLHLASLDEEVSRFR